MVFYDSYVHDHRDKPSSVVFITPRVFVCGMTVVTYCRKLW